MLRFAPWYSLMVLLAGACFGLISPLIKLAYSHGFSTAEATDAQYILGAVGLWLLVLMRRPRRDGIASPSGKISGVQWLVLPALGLASGGTSVTYYSALTDLPASLAIVLLFQFTWMVMVIDIFVTRSLPSRKRWIGAACILVGTVLAVGLLDHSLGHFPVWTIVYGLLAAFCYAITLYLSAYVDTRMSPYLQSAVIVTVATVAVLIAFRPTFLTDPAWMGSLGKVSSLLLWGGLMALFSQILPPLLMMIAIPRTGGRMAGVLGSIELPVAVFGAWLVVGDHVTLLRWLGVGLILAGIIVSEWPFTGDAQ